MDDILTFVGLMKKAKGIAIGLEDSLLACQKRKAKVLLMASDLSDKPKRRCRNIAAENGIVFVESRCTKSELGGALGQNECAALAIINTGFAESFCRKTGMDAEAEIFKTKFEREKKRLNKSKKALDKQGGK